MRNLKIQIRPINIHQKKNEVLFTFRLKDPRVIVISDIHLGSWISHPINFYQFLLEIYNRIRRKELRNLEYIFFLGDFFDLIARNWDWFSNSIEINGIFDILGLIRKENIKFYLTLGNHEIPLTKNYNNKFGKRKRRFLRNATKSHKLIETFQINQYILIKHNFVIHAFDNVQELKNEIKGSNYFYLLSHGFQYDNKVLSYFSRKMWKKYIKSDNTEEKEDIDFISTVARIDQIPLRKAINELDQDNILRGPRSNRLGKKKNCTT